MMHFVDELRHDMCGFQRFLHMSSQEFNVHLLLIITRQLQRTDTFMRDSISAKQMLVVTLRYLASGECMFADLNTTTIVKTVLTFTCCQCHWRLQGGMKKLTVLQLFPIFSVLIS